jgi:hypothetical protein
LFLFQDSAGAAGGVAELVDLVEVEHGGAVFHAEAAAGENDDVVADGGMGRLAKCEESKLRRVIGG